MCHIFNILNCVHSQPLIHDVGPCLHALRETQNDLNQSNTASIGTVRDMASAVAAFFNSTNQRNSLPCFYLSSIRNSDDLGSLINACTGCPDRKDFFMVLWDCDRQWNWEDGGVEHRITAPHLLRKSFLEKGELDVVRRSMTLREAGSAEERDAGSVVERSRMGGVGE